MKFWYLFWNTRKCSVKVFSLINYFRYSEQTSCQVRSQSPGLLHIRPQNCTLCTHNYSSHLSCLLVVFAWCNTCCAERPFFFLNVALTEYSCLVILTPFPPFCSAFCPRSAWIGQFSPLRVRDCHVEGELGFCLSASEPSPPTKLKQPWTVGTGRERDSVAARSPKVDQC